MREMDLPLARSNITEKKTEASLEFSRSLTLRLVLS